MFALHNIICILKVNEEVNERICCFNQTHKGDKSNGIYSALFRAADYKDSIVWED